MNWFTGERQIKTLLNRKETGLHSDGKKKRLFYGGVYIISRDLNEDKNGKLSYKIGLARGDKGLYDRVKSYKICYAYRDELFVQYMFVCLEKDNSEKLEKMILADTRLGKAEANPNKKEEGKQSREYRFVSKKDTLNDVLLDILNKNKDLWDVVIRFGANGWTLVSKDEGNLKSLSRPSDSYDTKISLSKYLEAKTDTAKESLKKSTFISPEILQIGDVGYVLYNRYKNKTIVSTPGKIVGKKGNKWLMQWPQYPSDIFQYPSKEVFTKEQAEKALTAYVKA